MVQSRGPLTRDKLMSLTKPELIALAKGQGVLIKEYWTKSEICDAIFKKFPHIPTEKADLKTFTEEFADRWKRVKTRAEPTPKTVEDHWKTIKARGEHQPGLLDKPRSPGLLDLRKAISTKVQEAKAKENALRKQLETETKRLDKFMSHELKGAGVAIRTQPAAPKKEEALKVQLERETKALDKFM